MMKNRNLLGLLTASVTAIAIAFVNPLGIHAQLGGVQTWA